MPKSSSLSWPLGLGVALAVLCGVLGAQTRVWLERRPRTTPPARFASPLAYDPVRQRFVMFGGYTGAQSLADTWEYDGADWIQIQAASAPTARHGHALAWDPVSQRVLLFGGAMGSVYFDDTWSWDGQAWIRHMVSGPSGRYLAAVGSTPARPGLVLLGGQDRSPFLADFWHWDGTIWTQLATTTLIGPRSQARMAFDPARGLVLVGGHTASGTFQNDSWSYNGTSWTRLTNVGAYGLQRASCGFAYVPDRGRLVVFGGGNPNGLGDTWELEPTGWQQIPTVAFPAPSPRIGVEMATDPVGGAVLMFGGGVDQFNAIADTWVYGEADPPSLTTHGVGCSWGGGTPQLDAPWLAWRGERFDLQLSQLPLAPPVGVGLLFGTVSLPPIDLGPLGAPGCSLWLSPVQPTDIVGGVSVGGVASWSMVVPATVAPGDVTWQGVVLVPGVNPLSAVFSNGLTTSVR